MIREYGNMWDAYEWADHFFITTNSFIKGNGDAVLGRGIALEAVKRIPKLPTIAGEIIRTTSGHLGSYGLIPNVLNKVGLFQVKHGWYNPADLALIAHSTAMLIRELKLSPWITSVALNMPGIGNGKLALSDVLPIVEELPDSVHIWTFK